METKLFLKILKILSVFNWKPDLFVLLFFHFAIAEYFAKLFHV